MSSALTGMLKPSSKASSPAPKVAGLVKDGEVGNGELDEKSRRIKAAGIIRRIIQKVRVANPDNFADLTVELSEELMNNADDLGDEEHTRLQEEADKGLIAGQKRVDQILEKRQQEELQAERPRELLKVYEDLIADFEVKTNKVKEEIVPGSITAEDAPLVQDTLKEHTADFQTFTQEVQKWMKANSAEISRATQLEVIKKEHQGLSQRAGKVIRDSNEWRKKVKEETEKAAEAARKALLARIKEDLSYKLEDVSVPVGDAELLVKHVERTVEPFAKIRLPDDMDEMAEQVESAIEIAKDSLTSAKRTLRPADDVEVEESIKKDVENWLKGEVKRYTIRVGQLDRRIGRAVQLIALYKADQKRKEELKILANLKDVVMERAKAITASEVLDPLEDVIRDAEKQCMQLSVGRGKKMEELKHAEHAAGKAIIYSKGAVEEARKKLYPFEDDLSEKVKKELQVLIEPFIRAHLIKVGQMERRVMRMEKMLENFQNELRKLNAAKVAKVKSAVTRLLRIAAKDEGVQLAPPDLFNHIDKNADGKISEFEWVEFLEATQSTVRQLEIDKTLVPLLELGPNDFVVVFEDLASGTASTDRAITKPVFLKLLPQYMQVVRATTMTVGVNIALTETVRRLRPGEYVEVLDGPGQDPNLVVDRLQVRALEDNSVGWATQIGNGGSIFMKEAKPPNLNN